VTAQRGSEIDRKTAAALEQLPLFERAALFLRDVAQLPLAAVADKLNCSIPEARLHIARGRVNLRRRLEGLQSAPTGSLK
jgi:DNA-directed RNA polymerase specialized sigma24 family protein